jgi:hypothetical protein
MCTCGITPRFRGLPPTSGQIAHVFLTRPPRLSPEGNPVRLACIRHAASVDPEPGSNSPPYLCCSPVRSPLRKARTTPGLDLCVLPVLPRPFGSGRIRQPPPSLRTTRPARIPRPCLTLEAGSLHSVFRAQPHPHTPENASQRPLRDGSLSTALTSGRINNASGLRNKLTQLPNTSATVLSKLRLQMHGTRQR